VRSKRRRRESEGDLMEVKVFATTEIYKTGIYIQGGRGSAVWLVPSG